MAASAAEPAPIYWMARGSYARRAGEQPRWLPGLRIALDQYQQLEPPVTLAEIKADARFTTFPLVRISRLSVMPVSDVEWKRIEKMAG